MAATLMRGATRCYNGASTSWHAEVPYRGVTMTDPTGSDDSEPGSDADGPLTVAPPSRLRQAVSIAIVLALIVSMVFLAWVSGRGEIEVRPVATPTPAPTGQIASRPAVERAITIWSS